MSQPAKPNSAGVTIHPPVILFLCLLGGIALAFWSHWTIPMVPWEPRLITGAVLALCGALFSLWGNRGFKSLGVNVRPNKPASRLVTTGAHCISRNPMYVGMVSFLVGVGWAAGSVPMLLSAIPMLLYLDWYVIPREEKYLGRTFGEEYKAYCKKVRRWL